MSDKKTAAPIQWAVLLCLFLGSGLAVAGELAREVKFHIPAQRLSQALIAFSEQSGVQIVTAGEDVSQLKTPGVSGYLPISAALRKLLDGTALDYATVGESTVALIGQAQGAAQAPVARGPAITLVQSAAPAAEASAQAARPAASATAKDSPQEMVITGTRIRGAKDQFSPTTAITREQMDLAGYTNLSQVIDTLPQNFGGGVSPDTVVAGDTRGAGSSGVNLRGLGHEATLVLVNGRRLAPGGLFGDFVDISALPAAAIERVEVLTDGASAIYGSDAIAGVVNILLRKDFSGAETRLGTQRISDGGSQEWNLGQTFGYSGERAHGLLTYEYVSTDALDSNDKSFSRAQPDPYDLLPQNRKHNVIASTGARITDRLELSADGFFNKRSTQGYYASDTYGLEQYFQEVNVQQAGGALGAQLKLPAAWQGDASVGYAKSKHRGVTDYLPSTTSGLFVDAAADVLSFDLSAGGPLFHFTDEAVRAVIGVHSRSESIDQLYLSRPTNRVILDREKSRHVVAAYSELYAPLVAESRHVPGVRRLAFSLAARYEDYNDIGSSFDPKAGIVWSPIEGLNVRGTYGTSFRAPGLNYMRDQLSAVMLVKYADPQLPGGETTALILSGYNSNLKPEQATTWSAGFDWTPQSLPQLQVRATYFNIDYTDRIGAPTAFFNSQSRFENFTGVLGRNPTPAEVQAYVAAASSFYDYGLYFPELGTLNLSDVSLILDQRAQNLVASQVDGVDLEFSFNQPSAVGDWTFGVNSTLLTTYTNKAAPTTPAVDLLNTFGNPVDLKLRGSVSWHREALTGALHVNYVDSYTDDKAVAGPRPIAAWTTVDMALRLDLGQMLNNSFARGASLALNANNLFNRNPPLTEISIVRATQYDGANADPVGRRVGLTFTKRW